MELAAKKLFISKLDPAQQAIVKALATAIESVDGKLTCEIKWGRLTYGLAGDYHHWICGIAPTKKNINLVFHFGGILNDKHKYFIIGDSFFLRKLEYSSPDVDQKVIQDFVRQALGRLEYFKNNWKDLNKKSKS